MGRYITQRGVIVDCSADKAQAMGYKPAEAPKPKPTPRRKSSKPADDDNE